MSIGVLGVLEGVLEYWEYWEYWDTTHIFITGRSYKGCTPDITCRTRENEG